MSKRLLITGATGFVGRNLLLKMIGAATYERIYVTVRSPEKLRAQLQGDGFDGVPPQVVPIEGGAHDWGVKHSRLLEGSPLHVVHCASQNFGKSRDEYFRVNVDGVKRLLEETEGAAATLLLSSQAAAGPCLSDQQSMREEDPDRPVTYYGHSKLAMEAEAQRYPQRKILILRPSMILGARDSATLPLFKMVRMPVRFYPGSEEKRYSFIAVNDLVEAIQSVLSNASHWPERQRPYYVAHRQPVTGHGLIEISAKLARRKGYLLSIPVPVLKVVSEVIERVPPLREWVPTLTRDRANEIWPNRWVISPSAFERDFQWQAVEPAEKALGDAHAWYVRTGQLHRH